MTVTITALQKQRRDTASNWTLNNTVLLAGEFGYETDTKKFKIGDFVEVKITDCTTATLIGEAVKLSKKV